MLGISSTRGLRAAVLPGLIFAAIAAPACTALNEGVFLGDEGHACYLGTCNSGLICQNDVCARPVALSDGWRDAGDGQADVLADLECASRPAKPALEGYPATTVHNKVVFKGTAKGARQVTVAGKSGSNVYNVTGEKFCAEVLLDTNATIEQTFYLTALDAHRCGSDAVMAKVTYDSNGTDFNVLLGKVALSSKDGHTAQDPSDLSLLTDKQVDRYAKFTISDTNADCDEYTWISYDLGVEQTVRKVVVKYPDKTPLERILRCRRLVVSTAAKPEDPKAGGSWTTADYQDAVHSTRELEIKIPVALQKTRHLALLMYEDNEQSSTHDYFEIAEVEAWGPGASPACN